MRNMRRWPVVLLLAAVLFACSRADSAPGGISAESQADTYEAGIVYRNTITQKEAETLNGGSFTGLEMSDEVIRSLAFLDRLPAVSSLLLTVKGEQPEEVLPYLSTMTATPADVLEALATEIPREQLAAFSERGDVYLFFDFRR